MRIPFEDQKFLGINEARPEGAGNTDEPLEHSEPKQEVRHMSHYGHYTDSTSGNNPEHQAKSGGAA